MLRSSAHHPKRVQAGDGDNDAPGAVQYKDNYYYKDYYRRQYRHPERRHADAGTAGVRVQSWQQSADRCASTASKIPPLFENEKVTRSTVGFTTAI